MFSFLNYLKQLINPGQEKQGYEQSYSTEQLIQQAIECMLESLPDNFYEASMICFRNVDSDGRTAIASIHNVKLTADSNYASFTPPDSFYTSNFIEKILAGKDWENATITFNHQRRHFSWK